MSRRRRLQRDARVIGDRAVGKYLAVQSAQEIAEIGDPLRARCE